MGGPRPMTTVPLTVVASSAVGRARSGSMPTMGRIRMTQRPTARCLREGSSRIFVGLTVELGCGSQVLIHRASQWLGLICG